MLPPLFLSKQTRDHQRYLKLTEIRTTLKERKNQLDSNSSVKPLDRQVGGNHYKEMKIQPVEFILANDLGFCEGNVVKYICRYKQKGGVEDLEKVIHYAQMLVDKMKETENV